MEEEELEQQNPESDNRIRISRGNMLRHLADEIKSEVLNTLAPSWRRLQNFPRYMSQSPFPLAFDNGEVEVQIRELVTRQG